MALKKTLAQRLFNIAHKSNSISTCRIISSSTPNIPDSRIAPPDPGDNGIFRRFLSPEIRSLPTGEKLIEKLREMDIVRSRISFDGLRPPTGSSPEGKLTVEDARKLLRLSQLETVKLNIRKIEKSIVSYAEFVQICSENSGNGEERGRELAKILDDSGTVIILGNVVFLRPDETGKRNKKFLQNEMVTFIKELDQFGSLSKTQTFYS